MGDLFAFQNEITSRIAIALGIELTGREAAQPIQNPDALAPWVADTAGSLLSSFGNGIRADLAAVMAALVEPWSNGQTEGQITKLKLVKRQMYGRAKLDLLRARLLTPA
jgi:transposase